MLATAALAIPAGAQPTGPACLACVHEEIKHHWSIQGHPRYAQDTLLQELCADVEFPAPEFRVTADGVEASQFEVDRVTSQGSQCDDYLSNPWPHFLTEDGRKILSPDPRHYGAIRVTAQDTHGLYFYYTHPTQPPPPGEVSRDVRIGFEFDRDGGRIMYDSMVIHVYRPPVVMTHGLWADATSFTTMEKNFSSVSHNYSPDLLYRVDYSGSHDAKFADNIAVVENGVAALMEQAADKDYAVGKVDLVGHSMGGILSRLYVQGQQYGDDVRRIVTCNTPHAGSQMANWLLDEVWDPYGLVCAALGATMGSCYNGAVCDLNVYSSGINTLLNAPFVHPGDVQVHALSTVSDIVSPLQGPIPSFISTSYIALIQSTVPFCSLPGLFDDIFRGEEHDAVVALPSQAGGLEGTKTSVFENQIHVGSTANQAVIDRVRNLLGEKKDSSSFTEGGYVPPRLSYTTPTFCTVPLPVSRPGLPTANAPARSPSAAAMTPVCVGGRSACCATANHAAVPLPVHSTAMLATTLAIDTPLPGTTLNAGQAFSATVVGSADVATIILLLSSHGDQVFLARLAGPVATFSLQVPLELVGEKILIAIGLTADGRQVATSNSVNLYIAIAATLQSLSVYPPALHLDPGRTAWLEVTGSYSDGIDRYLSQVAGMTFTFAEGNASRTGTNGVTLNALHDDALTITYQGVTTPEVAIRALPPAQPRVPKVPLRRRLRRT